MYTNLRPALSLLLALPSPAQQPAPTGYTIEGQDSRLAGRHVYLLAAERPSHTQPWLALDSAQAAATGRFALYGRVPAPTVYWLRLDKQRVLQPVPLAGRQEQLHGSVALSPSSTRQAPVYQLNLGGSPKVAWLQVPRWATLLGPSLGRAAQSQFIEKCVLALSDRAGHLQVAASPETAQGGGR